MRELLILAIHLLVTLAKLLRPGGVRAVAAESLLLKHQLLISSRSRQRAPNLTTLDRFGLGLTTLFVSPRRIAKLGALVKPATLFKFHKALVDQKYRLLFSSSSPRRKPGPKGPSAELIAAIVEMKRRNPKFGCMRIAQQLAHVFGIEIDKDVVRRVLAKHYRPSDTGANGPSWLPFIAQTKDTASGAWTYSAANRSSYVVTGCWWSWTCSPAASSVLASSVPTSTAYPCVGCSITPCLASAYRDTSAPTTTRCFGSTVGSPTCGGLEIEEIKSVPYTPVSHPFVERLIGTIRREYLDRMFFWNAVDLTRKLGEFRNYYNAHRVHRALAGSTPAQGAGAPSPATAALDDYAWRQHCRGLFQTPIAA